MLDPINPVSSFDKYVEILRGKLGGKPVTDEGLLEIEALPEVQQQLAAEKINPSVLRQAYSGKFLTEIEGKLENIKRQNTRKAKV